MTKSRPSKPYKAPRKLYFPPLLQFLLCAIATYCLAANTPALAYQSAPIFWLSIPFALAGLLMVLISVRSFAKEETTVNPIAPEKAGRLVTTGPYRFTRNPMYLGMLLLLVAVALAIQNTTALGGPLLFMASITFLQIIPEEWVLKENFGSAFAAYRRQTRRWL